MCALIQAARLNGLASEAYVHDVIGRIADHPINRIEQLLPWYWTPLAGTISVLSPTDQRKPVLAGRLCCMDVGSGRGGGSALALVADGVGLGLCPSGAAPARRHAHAAAGGVYSSILASADKTMF